MNRLARFLVLGLSMLPLARLNAAPTIELQNGKSIEVRSISRQGERASIVTSGGMRLDLPVDRIVSPTEKWLAGASEAEREGRTEDALEFLRLVAAWDPSRRDPEREASLAKKAGEGALRQFLSETAAGDYAAAAKTYKNLSQPSGAPSECQAALAQLLDNARQAADAGRFDEAAALCNGYLSIMPDSPEASRFLADIGSARGKADFERRLKRVDNLLANRQFDSAKRLLLDLQSENPDYAPIRAKIEELDRSVANERVNALLGKAKLALDNSDAETCQDLCAQLLARDPDHAEANELLQEIDRIRTEFFASAKENPCVVACKKHPGRSYFPFLPPAYDAQTPTAIVYVFSPIGGDDDGGLGRFVAGVAGKQGWIVVQSRDSRNGPWQPILEAQDAVFGDTSLRLNLHPARRFATGFSGGGRAALAMAFRYPGRITGVMPMGAVWPVNTDFQPTTNRLAVCILMGSSDDNRRSVPSDIQNLQRAGVRTNAIFYPAGHEWPSPAVFQNGLSWLAANAP